MKVTKDLQIRITNFYLLLDLLFQHGDEWKEFVEEEKKDYTGLKIQNLQINEDDNEKQKVKPESEEEVEIDDNGQTVVKKKPTGPWKVIQEQKVEQERPPPGMETVVCESPSSSLNCHIVY